MLGAGVVASVRDSDGTLLWTKSLAETVPPNATTTTVSDGAWVGVPNATDLLAIVGVNATYGVPYVPNPGSLQYFSILETVAINGSGQIVWRDSGFQLQFGVAAAADGSWIVATNATTTAGDIDCALNPAARSCGRLQPGFGGR